MRSQSGYTLIELMWVIAIAGVLVGIAIPSFRSMIQSAQSRDAATAFYTGLLRARSEAIARNQPVAICARNLAVQAPTCLTSGNWQNGWIVYQRGATSTTIVGDALYVQPPLPDSLQLTDGSTGGALTFDSAGRAADVTGPTTFTLCSTARPDKYGRQLQVLRNGRVTLELKTCAA